jgi:hypothetical protein
MLAAKLRNRRARVRESANTVADEGRSKESFRDCLRRRPEGAAIAGFGMATYRQAGGAGETRRE